MPSDYQLQESSNENKIHRTLRTMKSTSRSCFDCMVDFCLDAWDSTCILCQDVWSWTSDNVSYCCKTSKPEIRPTTEQKNRNHIQNQIHATTIKQSQIISTAPLNVDKENSDNSTLVKQVGNNIKQITTNLQSPTLQPRIKLTSNATTTTTNTITTTMSPTTPQNQNQKLMTNQQLNSNNSNNMTAHPEPTIRSGILGNSLESVSQDLSGKAMPSPTMTTTSKPKVVEKQLIKQGHSTESPTIKILPPKIDFVETGSIFGDRKRPTFDQSMLQIENGKFRSPGLSKVVRGPGGRNIRVSFVSGFPAIKSVDSKSSLRQFDSKTSRTSNDSSQPNLTNFHSVNSLDSTKKQQQTNTAFKSVKSIKSINSFDEN